MQNYKRFLIGLLALCFYSELGFSLKTPQFSPSALGELYNLTQLFDTKDFDFDYVPSESVLGGHLGLNKSPDSFNREILAHLKKFVDDFMMKSSERRVNTFAKLISELKHLQSETDESNQIFDFILKYLGKLDFAELNYSQSLFLLNLLENDAFVQMLSNKINLAKPKQELENLLTYHFYQENFGHYSDIYHQRIKNALDQEERRRRQEKLPEWLLEKLEFLLFSKVKFPLIKVDDQLVRDAAAQLELKKKSKKWFEFKPGFAKGEKRAIGRNELFYLEVSVERMAFDAVDSELNSMLINAINHVERNNSSETTEKDIEVAEEVDILDKIELN